MAAKGQGEEKMHFRIFAPSWLSALLIAATIAIAPGLASAHVLPKPCDFVTGGGFDTTNTGHHANFGLVAGCKHHSLFGHVNFLDHGIGLHVRSTSIMGYTEIHPGMLRRDVCGMATTDLYGTVAFHLVVIDNGEPGTHDRFGISLSNGYMLHTRFLSGGNIQLHKPNPSTTPPPHAFECNSISPDPGP
jgi:hypothetical protein